MHSFAKAKVSRIPIRIKAEEFDNVVLIGNVPEALSLSSIEMHKFNSADVINNGGSK